MNLTGQHFEYLQLKLRKFCLRCILFQISVIVGWGKSVCDGRGLYQLSVWWSSGCLAHVPIMLNNVFNSIQQSLGQALPYRKLHYGSACTVHVQKKKMKNSQFRVNKSIVMMRMMMTTTMMTTMTTITTTMTMTTTMTTMITTTTTTMVMTTTMRMKIR